MSASLDTVEQQANLQSHSNILESSSKLAGLPNAELVTCAPLVRGQFQTPLTCRSSPSVRPTGYLGLPSTVTRGSRFCKSSNDTRLRLSTRFNRHTLFAHHVFHLEIAQVTAIQTCVIILCRLVVTERD